MGQVEVPGRDHLLAGLIGGGQGGVKGQEGRRGMVGEAGAARIMWMDTVGAGEVVVLRLGRAMLGCVSSSTALVGAVRVISVTSGILCLGRIWMSGSRALRGGRVLSDRSTRLPSYASLGVKGGCDIWLKRVSGVL